MELDSLQDVATEARTGGAPLVTAGVTPPAPETAVAPARNKGGGRPGNSGGKRGRSGPPKNRHAWRHGLRATGALPKDALDIRRAIGKFKRALEAATLQRWGEITVGRWAHISSAVRHELLARLSERYLMQMADDRQAISTTATKEANGATMKATTTKVSGGSYADRGAFLDRISRETDLRDRCIRALDLDGDSRADIFDALYRDPPTIRDVPAPEPTE